MVFSVFSRVFLFSDPSEKSEAPGCVFCPDSCAFQTGNVESLDLSDPSAGVYAALRDFLFLDNGQKRQIGSCKNYRNKEERNGI